MLKNAVTVALTVLILGAPLAGAQSVFDTTADTGDSGRWSDPTNTQYQQDSRAWPDALPPAPAGKSQPTRAQGVGGALPGLAKTVTGMPNPDGSMEAGGNIALQNQKLKKLPPVGTDILSGNIGSGEPVVGDEGAYINGYSQKNALINLMDPGLTTGHPSDAPPVSGN